MEDPCPGDFVKLVDIDLKKVDLNIESEEMESMNAQLFIEYEEYAQNYQPHIQEN